MRSLEGGGWKSTNTGNSLAAYPTSSPVLKSSGEGDFLADFNSLQGVAQAQNEEYERKEREWQEENEKYLNSIDWESKTVKYESTKEEEEEVF